MCSSDLTISLEEYENEGHVVISLSGQTPAIIDREVAKLGIKRRVILQIPNFLGAAFVAEHTDLILTVPQRLAELLVERGEFKILPVPFTLPTYEVKLHWHERLHHDEANRWLRKVISELLAK